MPCEEGSVWERGNYGSIVFSSVLTHLFLFCPFERRLYSNNINPFSGFSLFQFLVIYRFAIGNEFQKVNFKGSSRGMH